MRWNSISELLCTLAKPPIALPLPGSSIVAALPRPRMRSVPPAVGDPTVDRALAVYAVAVDRGRAAHIELCEQVDEHSVCLARFRQGWLEWARTGRHRAAEEPDPNVVVAAAERVLELRDAAERAIGSVEPAWRKVLDAVGRNDDLRATRVEIALGARRAYLDAVADLEARYVELAIAEAVSRWCEQPARVTFAAQVNPIAFRAVVRDQHGVNLRRVVAALVELAGPEPATDELEADTLVDVS